MPIRVLPARLSSLIAAGEVIDRPSSVVRELVDNALDAGAEDILIQARGTSCDRIVVTDTGAGMSPDDLALAFLNHATSKLRDELMQVETLGFRGEALPSIARVASVTLTSRPKEQDVAFQVSAKETDIGKVRPAAGFFGSRVEVSDIFASHPVRRKFMKSRRSEKAHILHVVERQALAHPGVRFQLDLDASAKTTSWVAVSCFTQRVRDLRGEPLKSDGIALLENDIGCGYRLEGLISMPSATSERGQIEFFVNGRPIQPQALSKTVHAAYRELIGDNARPVACLHLTVPAGDVDVNVHPQKSEVRFLRPEAVGDFVYRSVRKTLHATGLRSSKGVFDMARSLAEPVHSPTQDDSRLPLGRYIGQAQASWLISETADGIAIVDQHAAHERVILERLKAAERDQETVTLVSPLSMMLPALSQANLEEALPFLCGSGFHLSISGTEVRLHRYPSVLSDLSPREILRSLTDACHNGLSGNLVAELVWQRLATAACKAAIKAGQALTSERASALLREIEATPNGATCNHGRPTVLFLSHQQIEKLFARS